MSNWKKRRKKKLLNEARRTGRIEELQKIKSSKVSSFRESLVEETKSPKLEKERIIENKPVKVSKSPRREKENVRVSKTLAIDYKYPKCFGDIRREFKRGYSDDVFNSLERGRAILSTEEQLRQYLHSYGPMHREKLIKAYQTLFEFLNISKNEKIEIFDYACGQGIGAIVLLNEIEEKKSFNLANLLGITLIEPSNIALECAKSFLDKSAHLYSVNKCFDYLTQRDLKSNDNAIKIHIFSNILDMEVFNVEKLVYMISKTQSGVNYFVCVSALNKDKLDNFMNKFKGHKGFKCLSSLDGSFSNEQEWKMKCNIFKVGG
jgi:methylase of polypeptide subunit release factors